ncbi:putative MFS family arabinose efflux permease [Pseudonocardia sediminis]|uniref:Putative MFS family arabinose efflux permease n=1 Tax=Pseudonocardia sediminis TaxID=1397368 RepID=A0A4V2FQN4_PSEST|nr:MFS transporter [Pseudonocardia sediminis]RZT85400.1 putative MFS family arabinose efflux permease [Pseudonocardia sediminis]
MNDAAGHPPSSTPPSSGPPSSTQQVEAGRSELWARNRRATTVGMLLLISLTAFESMGVGTAMPAVVADLGGVALYSWPFVVFMAAAVFGTALGGWWCDARGPRVALVAAPALFGFGLIVAGTAEGMGQLLLGRLLQGLGAGVQGVAVYVLIAAVYPERARPAVFGAVSSAWVVPSLVGPPLAGLVTDRLSWHWVFLGLVPIVFVAVALVLPAVRDLGPPDPDTAAARGGAGLVLAAFGAAAGVAGLSWALGRLGLLGGIVGVVAVVVLVPSLRRLLPSGVFRARRGIAASVAARGLVAGAFFTVGSFLPLVLTATHGWSLTAAGLPLIVASLGWSGAAAWQGRRPEISRSAMLRNGFLLIAAGIVGLWVVAAGLGYGWLALPFWGVSGVGMGLAFSAISYLVLAHSRTADVGSHSSAAQLLDQLSTAGFIGLGGALLSLLVSPTVAMPVLLVVLVVLALTGAATAGRTAVTA